MPWAIPYPVGDELALPTSLYGQAPTQPPPFVPAPVTPATSSTPAAATSTVGKDVSFGSVGQGILQGLVTSIFGPPAGSTPASNPATAAAIAAQAKKDSDRTKQILLWGGLGLAAVVGVVLLTRRGD
jgi:hypothetical protein